MYATRIWEQNINIIRMCDSVDTLFHPTFAFFFSNLLFYDNHLDFENSYNYSADIIEANKPECMYRM